jgi:sulfhydrogenase subunit beta (sulfur reductase)
MMGGKVFAKESWIDVLEDLRRSYRVFVPVKEGDYHNFRLFDNGTRPGFDFQNTRLSPKFLVLPQSERVFECSLDETSPDAHILKESPKDFAPRLIVGIRPCDADAIERVKINFDNPRYRDPWWVRHYEATTFVGLGCNTPCETCFCTSVGSGPFSETGLDVLLFDLGDRYLAKACTGRGEDLIAKMRGGEVADESTIQEADALARAAEKRISSKVSTDGLKEKAATALFEAPFWEEVAFPCLNCGTCTYLCPTCWCFDLQDETWKKEGDRIRNWDGCMFPLFTLHGSGHNPRGKKVQRVRQRFMHKMKYHLDKYGDGVSCVGCGRCVQFCPVNIDIREVIQLMNNL